jgi:hypothetical protein
MDLTHTHLCKQTNTNTHDIDRYRVIQRRRVRERERERERARERANNQYVNLKQGLQTYGLHIIIMCVDIQPIS